MVITAQTTLGEIAEKYPQAADYLMKEWKLHCVGCFANVFDTLEAGMKLHGYRAEDIEAAVRDLNQMINEVRSCGEP